MGALIFTLSLGEMMRINQIRLRRADAHHSWLADSRLTRRDGGKAVIDSLTPGVDEGRAATFIAARRMTGCMCDKIGSGFMRRNSVSSAYAHAVDYGYEL